LHGVLKSYSAEKGFGFIHCPETMMMFQRDVCIRQKEMEKSQAEVGATVSFLVTVSKEGQPLAKQVEVVGGSGGADGGAGGTCAGVSGSGGAVASSQLPAAFAQRAPEAASVSALAANSAASTRSPGAMSPVDPTHFMFTQYAQYAAALQSQQGGGGLGGASADNLASRGRGGGPFSSHDPNRRYVGIVTKWMDDEGFGFIGCVDSKKVYGKDVFLHRAQVGNEADLYKQRTQKEIGKGDKVSFQVEISKGMPRARDVDILEQASSGNGAQPSIVAATLAEAGLDPTAPTEKKRRRF